MPDFDLEKLFRGELGPNVAEELAAKCSYLFRISMETKGRTK